MPVQFSVVLVLFIRLFFLCFFSGSKFLHTQERQLQTVDLCLRLDLPHLPQPRSVPPSALGDSAPSSLSVNPQLSQVLRSVLGDEANNMLQEMVVVENVYLIGKYNICDLVSAASI